jgi:hypothetical protein
MTDAVREVEYQLLTSCLPVSFSSISPFEITASSAAELRCFRCLLGQRLNKFVDR